MRKNYVNSYKSPSPLLAVKATAFVANSIHQISNSIKKDNSSAQDSESCIGHSETPTITSGRQGK